MATNVDSNINSPINEAGNALKACDIKQLLREKIALLTGGRDRSGRSLITFPFRDNAEKTTFDELRQVLLYLHAIPCDATKELGFVALIDMRRGVTWNAVKPILKTLNDFFPSAVHLVIILKPDNFWEKQKASVSSGKYKFEVNLTSLNGLSKYVDSAQLTQEFDGTLIYDHDEWLEMRMELESFIWRSMDVLRMFDAMKHEMDDTVDPADVDAARIALDEHNKAKKRIAKAPVDQLELEGQQLIQKLTGSPFNPEEISPAAGPSFPSTNLGSPPPHAPLTFAAGAAESSDYGSGSGVHLYNQHQYLNPDFTAAAPHIFSLLNNLRSTRNDLYNLWNSRRQRLEQCLHWKLFEQDADKMFNWLRQHIELFLTNYADIGDSHDSVLRAQHQHEQFCKTAMNTYVNIAHIITVATRLLDSGHYASRNIKAVADKLECDWGLFMSALEMRQAVLGMSLQFHYKAMQYMTGVETWKQQFMEETDVANTVQALETSIQENLQLIEKITQQYGEADRDGKNLIHALKNLPTLTVGGSAIPNMQMAASTSSCPMMSNGPASLPNNVLSLSGPSPQNSVVSALILNQSISSVPDYKAGANHVLDVIHQLLAQQRTLEQQWQQRRVKLHQRLALLLFQQDVAQVLDWLDKHGEMFLRKNTGAAKTLQRAKNLLKSQQNFDNVAKNTYSNAKKLLSAAQELAGTGVCHPQDIFEIEQQLSQRIANFEKRVNARRTLLNFSVLFHTHYKEIMLWFNEVDRLDAAISIVGDTAEDCERTYRQWLQNNDQTDDATNTAIQEGRQLVALLRQQCVMENTDNTESIAYIEQMMSEIDQRHTKLRDQFKSKELLFDLGKRFRAFEKDCASIVRQLDDWNNDMNVLIETAHVTQIEMLLQVHNDNASQVRNAISVTMHHAHELIQLIHASGSNLITTSEELVTNYIMRLVDRIRDQERSVMSLSDRVRNRLEQMLDLAQLRALADHAQSLINTEEQMFMATFTIPSSLSEAEQLQSGHKQFQLAIEKTNEQICAFNCKAGVMCQKDERETAKVSNIVERVNSRWRRLIALTDERHKLLVSACTYYKTLIAVLPLLDSDEEDYIQSRDWCSLFSNADPQDQKYFLSSLPVTPRDGSSSSCFSANNQFLSNGSPKCQDKVTFMSKLLSKHMDEKEKFLRSCTLAKKNSEIFLKYISRSLQQSLQRNTAYSIESMASKIKNDQEQLHHRENRILQLWTQKKRQLDQCQEFVLLEASAGRVLKWIQDEGETYLRTRPSEPTNKTHLDSLVEEHNKFVEAVKEQREKVRIFLELGDGMVHKDSEHAHSKDIHHWMTAVRQRYTDFSQRMDKYRVKLETIGSDRKSQIVARDLTLDRRSDPYLDAKLKESKEVEDAKRKSAKRKEFIMAELLQTERTYIKDLELCISTYVTYENAVPSEVPGAIKDKKDAIFLNMEDIYKFHNEVFVKELEKYDSIPEDVGHCFVIWAERLQELYVHYSLHNQTSVLLLKQNDNNLFFQKVQEKFGLAQPVQSYTIKPTQRICKYPLLLKELLSCCPETKAELKDKDNLGEFLLQNAFTVWDPRYLLKKGRDRQVFLFDLGILFCKRVNEQHEPIKFIYKNRLLISEINVTEHVEGGDKCKFALWTGKGSNNESSRIYFKIHAKYVKFPKFFHYYQAPSEEVKLTWIKRLRELIKDRIMNFELPYMHPPKMRPSSSATNSTAGDSSNRASKDSGDYGTIEMTSSGKTFSPDTYSLNSFSTTIDNAISATNSDIDRNVQICRYFFVTENFKSQPTLNNNNNCHTIPEILTVEQGDIVFHVDYYHRQNLDSSAETPNFRPNFKFVKLFNESGTGFDKTGFLPDFLLKPLSSKFLVNSDIPCEILNLSNDSIDNLAMKRRSIKKWFTSSMYKQNSVQTGDLNLTKVQRQSSIQGASSCMSSSGRPKSGDYGDSLTNRENNNCSTNDKLSRKAASVYSKLKMTGSFSGKTNKSRAAESYEYNPKSPTTNLLSDPIASSIAEHDFSACSESVRPGTSTVGCSTTAAAGPAAVNMLISQSEDDLGLNAAPDDSLIEIPPPMDSCLASEKLQNAVDDLRFSADNDNVAGCSAKIGSNLPSQFKASSSSSSSASVSDETLKNSTTIIGNNSSSAVEGMAQEIEEMVRLRLAGDPNNSELPSAINAIDHHLHRPQTSGSSSSSANNQNPFSSYTDHDQQQRQNQKTGIIDDTNVLLLNNASSSMDAGAKSGGGGDSTTVDNVELETDQQLSAEDQAKAKRKYVLMELVESERHYVNDLGSIVEGYIPNMEPSTVPEDMKGKEKFVFANTQQLYEFHKNTFLPEIEKCLDNYDVVGRCFVKYERRLHMYVVYCQNKPTSEYLVGEYEAFFNEIKQKLGHRLTLGDLLIKPVQRIMKYQLLLKDILKYTERSNESTEFLKKALQVMHFVPKACDDMMHVGRLQNFEGKITAQGKLLHQGTLLVSDNPSTQTFKGKDRRVFLFEQSLIIADCILPKKEFSNPSYIYKLHFLVNKMAMDTEVPNEPLRFVLRNKDPSSSSQQDVLVQCAGPDEKQQWVTVIKQLLDTQMNFLKALHNPIAYQKELSKEDNHHSHHSSKHHKANTSVKSPASVNQKSSNKNAGGAETTTNVAPSGNVSSAAKSPKSSTKSKLFDGFRNPLKSNKSSNIG